MIKRRVVEGGLIEIVATHHTLRDGKEYEFLYSPRGGTLSVTSPADMTIPISVLKDVIKSVSDIPSGGHLVAFKNNGSGVYHIGRGYLFDDSEGIRSLCGVADKKSRATAWDIELMTDDEICKRCRDACRFLG